MRLAEHLIAAAHAHDRGAGGVLGTHPRGEALPLEPGEVAERVLGAGQHHEVVAASVRRRRRQPVRPVQQTEVGGVRRPRQLHDRDGRARRRRPARAAIDGQAVLGVDADVLGEGEHAQAGRAGVLLEEGAAVVEQRPVAAELVDQEAAEQPPLVRRQQRHRAGDRRDHPAALDVRDQHPRRAEPGDEPEVHQIVRAQVQLADAAGAFDHDHVEAARQIGVGGEDLADQRRRRRRSSRAAPASSTPARAARPGWCRCHSA